MPKQNIITQNIDFNVRLDPAYYKDGNNNVIAIPNRYVTIREDTNEPLAIVGSHYRVQPHIDNIEMVADILDKLGLEYTVTNFVEGARVYSRFILEQKILLTGDNKSKLYIDVTNSYDGTKSFEILLALYRMICTNGMYGFANEFTLRRIHSQNLFIDMQLLENLQTSVDAYSIRFRNFFNTIVSEKPIPQNILEENFGIRLINKAEELVEVPNGSAWDQYNSFTNAITHTDNKQITKLNHHKLLMNLFVNYYNLKL